MMRTPEEIWDEEFRKGGYVSIRVLDALRTMQRETTEACAEAADEHSLLAGAAIRALAAGETQHD